MVAAQRRRPSRFVTAVVVLGNAFGLVTAALLVMASLEILAGVRAGYLPCLVFTAVGFVAMVGRSPRADH